MSIVYIGVDGGLSGAIAFYRPDPCICLDVIDIPQRTRYLATGDERHEVDVKALHALLSSYIDSYSAIVKALIERGQGDRKQSTALAYTYGFASGEVSATVKSRAREAGFIEALTWKRYFGLVGKDKEQSRALASSIFGNSQWPNKGHHNRAEAALIARYLAEQGIPPERPAPAPKRKTSPRSTLTIDG